MRSLFRLATRAIGIVILLSIASQARVVRVEVTSRTDIQNGKPFGLVGAYERITGRVYFKVNPGNLHNRQIVDLDKAPRDAHGDVEFSSNLYMIKPKDMNKGNGAVLFEVSNRGGKGILRIANGGGNPADPATEFGDGFLMRQGYTIAWVGWEYDVADQNQNLRLDAPVAREPDGKEIRGLVRSDFTPAEKRDEMPVGHILLGATGGKSYGVDETAVGNYFASRLTVRDTPLGERAEISADQWSITREGRFVHLNGGFQPGKIYELVYAAKDPVVVGLGLAAVRDFLSYLKYDPQSAAPVHRVYAVGISQSGRFLRHFLYQDFNADEQGRQVMDGMIAHVAGAGRGSFNHQFAQPSRDAQPMSSLPYRA